MELELEDIFRSKISRCRFVLNYPSSLFPFISIIRRTTKRLFRVFFVFARRERKVTRELIPAEGSSLYEMRQ